jgi:NRPS condensation-like uncharacterized protein
MNPLELAPQTTIARPLSAFEYWHAATGTSAQTLDPSRIITMVLEGESTLTHSQLKEALRVVIEANPGLLLRIEGTRQRARWTCDRAIPVPLRVIENCAWDGRSPSGMEAIQETPLSLNPGPGAELLLATGAVTRIILRVHHALVDGSGILHFFEELFRALRCESLLGTNACFSDVELMHAFRSTGLRSKGISLIPPTGGAQNAAFGDVWQRLTLPARARSNLMGHIAEAAARCAWSFRKGPVRIAVAVDLRRHVPGLKSTMNYASLVYVDLEFGETAQEFRRKLHKRLDENGEIIRVGIVDILRYLPFTWLDRLTGRTPQNYMRRKLFETVVISNLGTIDVSALSCPQFRATNYYCLPVMGNAFITVSTFGDHLNLLVGMPAVYASAGRLERFMERLREGLGRDAQEMPAPRPFSAVLARQGVQAGSRST